MEIVGVEYFDDEQEEHGHREQEKFLRIEEFYLPVRKPAKRRGEDQAGR